MTLESSSPGSKSKSKSSFHPLMSSYKRPTPDRLANHHFWEMGQRLNLEQDALAAILPEHRSQAAAVSAVAGHGYELSHSTSNHLHPNTHTSKTQFTLPSDTRSIGSGTGSGSGPGNGQGFKRGSVRNIQEMMGRLAGMDSQRVSMPPPPTKIIVTRHEEQRSD